MKQLVCSLLLLVVGGQGGDRKKRFLNEKWWDQFHSGVSKLEGRSGDVAEGLSGWADQVEKEMRPAIDKFGDQLGGLMEGLVGTLVQDNPLFKHSMVDRKDGMSIITGDHSVAPGHLFSSSFSTFGSSFNRFGGEMTGLGSLSGDNMSDMFGDKIDRAEQHRPMFDPFSIFGLIRKPWYQGENVCTEREVVDEEPQSVEVGVGGLFNMNMKMTKCQEHQNMHECTTALTEGGVKKTVIVRHSCCHGHSRDSASDGNCRKLDMKTVVETVMEVGGGEFLALLTDNEMVERLEDGNVTVFVPSDDAIEDFHNDLLELNKVDSEDGEDTTYKMGDGLTQRRKRALTIDQTPRLQDILLAHMVEGFHQTSGMKDEVMMETMAPGFKGVRLTVYNTWPTKVVMANCARLVSKDNMATNGVVHLVDKVIVPAKHTISSLLSEDLGLTQFASALQKAGMTDLLEGEGGQYTVFAPTNKAMDRLESSLKARLASGSACAADILRHHVLPNVICGCIVEDKVKTNNLADKYLTLSRDEEGVLMVEGVRVVMRDMVGTNGVVHVIEDVIVPESARSVPETLEKLGRDLLMDLVTEAKMTDDDFSNVTLFLPSEKALKELPEDFVTELKNDPEKLHEFLHYHIARPKTCKCEYHNNLILPSTLGDKEIRVNKYGSGLMFGPKEGVTTAQCAKIVSHEQEVCGGMINTVDKVLLPPAGDITEVVKNTGHYAKFQELLEFSGLTSELQQEGGMTLLVPSDKAFDKLDKEELDRMFEDQDFAQQVVRKHLLSEFLCCAGIQRNNLLFNQSRKRSVGGQIVSMRRTNSGHLYADRSSLSKCDMVGTNGVVHQVDSVLVVNTQDHLQEREDTLANIFKFNPFKFF